MSNSARLLVATQNKGKQKELKTLLFGCGLELVFPGDIEAVKDLDVDEFGQTIRENSFLKSQAFSKASRLLTISDDSCLEVDTLGGAPGVHSKRFFEGSGSQRNQEIIRQLKEKENRRARYKACLCLVDTSQDSTVLYFEGVIEGNISKTERGSEGFDYDRIFIPEGSSQTFAELGAEFKNKISHRTQAINKLKKYLRSKYG